MALPPLASGNVDARLARLPAANQSRYRALRQRDHDSIKLRAHAYIDKYIEAYQNALGDRSSRDRTLDPTQYEIDPNALRADMDWYRLELEIAAADNDPGALERIETLLGISLEPPTVRK